MAVLDAAVWQSFVATAVRQSLRPASSGTPVGDGLIAPGWPLQDYPDELMIDWGSVPAGSTARIYWPQANAPNVLDLATKLYGVPRLRSDDAHTIALTTTRGVSYVPIPFDPGAAKFAGLFTLDLPSTVRTGEELNVQVRRVASRRLSQVAGTIDAAVAGGGAVIAPAERRFMRNWRYVTGTFQVDAGKLGCFRAWTRPTGGLTASRARNARFTVAEDAGKGPPRLKPSGIRGMSD